jgi:hypothetical protein
MLISNLKSSMSVLASSLQMYSPWPAGDPVWAETFLALLYRGLDDWARHGRK